MLFAARKRRVRVLEDLVRRELERLSGVRVKANERECAEQKNPELGAPDPVSRAPDLCSSHPPSKKNFG